ncbi:MAG TPA: hypothetical protein VGC45_07025 [Gryllotalpicola sp.]
MSSSVAASVGTPAQASAGETLPPTPRPAVAAGMCARCANAGLVTVSVSGACSSGRNHASFRSPARTPRSIRPIRLARSGIRFSKFVKKT